MSNIISRNGKIYLEVGSKGIGAYLSNGEYYLCKADLNKKQDRLEEDLILYNQNDYEIDL